MFFCSLFAPPLLDDADATHANAARAMVTTGDLVTMRVDGVRYLEKAPLPYWLAATSFKVFGFNVFAAHLPQALAVLLLMLVGYRWANQAFGARTGYYTALGILTSMGVFLFSRILIPEALLSLELAAALFAFLKVVNPRGVGISVSIMRTTPAADGAPPPERPSIAWYAGPDFYAYLMWFSLALAVLTKGLVGLLLFGVTALVYLGLVGELFERVTWRRMRLFSGLLSLVAVAAPWHILAGMRNPGFWRFYFWNEHVLRFMGQREPHDYNRLPAWLYWAQHVVWLFPWVLFLPLGIAALHRRNEHQTRVLTRDVKQPKAWQGYTQLFVVIFAASWITNRLKVGTTTYLILLLLVFLVFEIGRRRRAAGLTLSPFHRIDAQQRSILLLSLFAAATLIFFSLSTNQEYYTLPAYLPLLLLIGATITRAEQTYATAHSSRRWITFAHAAFSGLGVVIAVALLFGLAASWGHPYTADVGSLLAHRGVGDYTLSMSHLFDLTTSAFAGLRGPAALAAMVFALGPAMAWMLRMQRRHIAATSMIGFTAAAFLIAAQLAFVRFGPMLSSRNFAERVQAMERMGQIGEGSEVMLLGDQAYGSSFAFYLGRPVELVDGRSTSMLFGAGFADAPPVFLTSDQMLARWGRGTRKILFVPSEKRADAAALLGARPMFVIAEISGKLLLTDRAWGQVR